MSQNTITHTDQVGSQHYSLQKTKTKTSKDEKDSTTITNTINKDVVSAKQMDSTQKKHEKQLQTDTAMSTKDDAIIEKPTPTQPAKEGTTITRSDTIITVASEYLTSRTSTDGSFQSFQSLTLPFTQPLLDEEPAVKSSVSCIDTFHRTDAHSSTTIEPDLYVCDYPGCREGFETRMDLYVHRIIAHSP